MFNSFTSCLTFKRQRQQSTTALTQAEEEERRANRDKIIRGSSPRTKKLFYAAGKGNKEEVLSLLEDKADPDQKHGVSRFFAYVHHERSYCWIVERSPLTSHEMLVFNSLSMQWLDWTALFWASSKGDVCVVKLLLKYGANTEVKNNVNKT